MASEAKKGPAVSGSEGLFGRIAVNLGFITEDQLKECLGEQDVAKKDGRDLRVGQILLKRRWLTTTQFLRIMSEQESRVGNSEGRPTMVRGEIEEASKSGADMDTPAPVSQITPGRTLGRYEILRQIGRGGMGVVYEARDTLLKRRVALKVLREDMVDAMMGRRLEKEAVTAARLKHPNIVTLFEAGIADEVRFLSMEYIEGKSLRDVMESPELDIHRKVEIVEQLARAVDYAHSRGVVHRDLKPGNIMIDTEGRPMVMDFGLARVLDDFSHASKTGALVGTPGYMAPEQIMGTSADVNARTDVYALGVIFYEMLSGRLPFDGRNPSEICSKILQSEPPMIEGIPPELQHVVRKAMHRDRNERYSTAGEFGDELRRFREDEPVRAAPRSIRKIVTRGFRRHRAAAAVVGMVLVGVLTLVAVLVFTKSRRESEMRQLRQEAMEAEKKGDWESAVRHWLAVSSLGDEGAASAARAAQQQLDTIRDRVRSVQLRKDAAEGEKEFRRIRGELLTLEDQIREERAKIEPYDRSDSESKKNLRSLERRIEKLRTDLRRVEARVTGLHISVTAVDPSGAKGLVDFLWTLLRYAEEEGDVEKLRTLEETIRQVAEERRLTEERQRLEKGGLVTIVSDPPGADVDLYVFEETGERRLMYKPEKMTWARTPVNSAALRAGSYLFILRRSGYRDTRLPVLLTRGQEFSAKVNLFTNEEIGGESYMYVPGGEFLMGDPKSSLGVERRTRVNVADFFIGRHEVSVGEYQEFLNDRSVYPTAEEAAKHAPRHSPSGKEHAKIDGNRILIGGMDAKWPVHEIDWNDARRYCQWLTEKSGGKAEYRLPKAVEWEKAARGCDGRAFPWGDYFDWTFTTGFYSSTSDHKYRACGITPSDESVYGVRDMAGNVSEWCADWFDPSTQRLNMTCGGSAPGMIEASFRAASRSVVGAGRISMTTGFRVVKVPPKR